MQNEGVVVLEAIEAPRWYSILDLNRTFDILFLKNCTAFATGKLIDILVSSVLLTCLELVLVHWLRCLTVCVIKEAGYFLFQILLTLVSSIVLTK